MRAIRNIVATFYQKHRISRPARIYIEPLEARTLLSASVSNIRNDALNDSGCASNMSLLAEHSGMSLLSTPVIQRGLGLAGFDRAGPHRWLNHPAESKYSQPKGTAPSTSSYSFGSIFQAAAGGTFGLQAGYELLGGPTNRTVTGSVTAHMYLETPKGEVLIGTGSSSINILSYHFFLWNMKATIPEGTAPGSYYVLETATVPGTSPAYENIAYRVTITPPLTLPLVQLIKATTVNAKSVTVNYSVSGKSITQQLRFDVYRSSTDSLSTGTHVYLGSTTLGPSDLTVGVHSAALISGTSLPPDIRMEYIIVAANQDGKLAEAPGSSNTAYFQKLVLGVVSHGYIPLGDLITSVPYWEDNMANDLRGNALKANYNAVIPFNWVLTSNVKAPGMAIAAGNTLFAQVVTEAHKLAAAHEGDVVDMHFIGHSRGAVVVNQAILDLHGIKDATLEGSYIRETLLDPHPANKATLALSLNKRIPRGAKPPALGARRRFAPGRVRHVVVHRVASSTRPRRTGAS